MCEKIIKLMTLFEINNLNCLGSMFFEHKFLQNKLPIKYNYE